MNSLATTPSYRNARRTPRLSGLLVTALVLLLGCQHRHIDDPPLPTDRTHEVEGDAEQDNLVFDWQQRGPLDFIEVLVNSYAIVEFDQGPDAEVEQQDNAVIVHGIHRGWILEGDIPDLIALLDDQRPCFSVRMARSSFIHRGAVSTVSNEAHFMIEGFRSEDQGTGYRGYPPALDSLGRTVVYGEGGGVIEWWADRERGQD